MPIGVSQRVLKFFDGTDKLYAPRVLRCVLHLSKEAAEQLFADFRGTGEEERLQKAHLSEGATDYIAKGQAVVNPSLGNRVQIPLSCIKEAWTPVSGTSYGFDIKDLLSVILHGSFALIRSDMSTITRILNGYCLSYTTGS